MSQMAAFSDELQKIASVKLANVTQLQQHLQAPPPTALGSIKTKAPKKNTLSPHSVPSYSKVHSIPTPSPMVGYQPTSAAPPAVRT